MYPHRAPGRPRTAQAIRALVLEMARDNSAWGYRQQNPPAGRVHPPIETTSMRILRKDRLGGLIREYVQVA